MKTCNRRYEAAVEEVAKRVLGRSSVSLAPIATYPDSIVYRVASGGNALIFKGHDPDGHDRDGIATEASALQRAKDAGVPAPDVVEVDRSAATFPSSYVVMTQAAGVPLDTLEPADVVRSAPALGEMLRRLHGSAIDAFDARDSAGWHDSVARAIPDSLRYLERLPADVVDLPRLERSVSAALAVVVEPERSVLLHGDMGENHVFVDPATGDITSVIDFGETATGLWIWDLLEFRRPLVPLILDGYGVGREEREEINRLVVTYALLKAVPWAAKWHARGEPQVLAWLRHSVEMFGETSA